MRFFTALATFLAGSSTLYDAQEDNKTTVNLRIEGQYRMIFEGKVQTSGHIVTTKTGGTHPCDGTNNHKHPKPIPVVTSALDDAAKQNNFDWDGRVALNYSDNFDDFFITRIANNTASWVIYQNNELAGLGGCQECLGYLDYILFSTKHRRLLKLEGPTKATVNKPVQLSVVDGGNNSAVAGAQVDGYATDMQVDGHVTDVAGRVILTFGKAGTCTVKAEKNDFVRSNGLKIVVT
ncbi:hypothetical protein AX17_006436 [Amanita inopinata Kibby_2008]|nr:hypothetical protein AX17_006436 [Amanita inopinata Kibby_2008]